MTSKSINGTDEKVQTLWRMVNGLVSNFGPAVGLQPVNVLMMIIDLAVMALARFSEPGIAEYLCARAAGLEAKDPARIKACHARAVAAGGKIVAAAVAEAAAKERRLS